MVNAVLVSCILLAAGLAARGSAGAAGFAAERQHALDQPVDISAAGAEIDDAHAQAVAAVERGRRQRDFSGGHQLCLYAGVDAIDRFRAGAVGPVAEAADAQPRRKLLEPGFGINAFVERSEEHTSELQSLMRISYAVFCLQKKN